MNPNCNYTTTGGCSCTQPANPCPPSPPNPCPPPPPPPPCPPACPPGCMPVPPYPPMPPRPPVPPPPRAEEADVDCGCGCAAGMLGALELLCDPRLAPLVDYSQFAFFTPNFVLGTSLNCPDTATTAYDNLTGPLAGEFVSIKPCTCDDLEVSGQIYYPIPVCAADSCCASGPCGVGVFADGGGVYGPGVRDAGRNVYPAQEPAVAGAASGKTSASQQRSGHEAHTLRLHGLPPLRQTHCVRRGRTAAGCECGGARKRRRGAGAGKRRRPQNLLRLSEFCQLLRMKLSKKRLLF